MSKIHIPTPLRQYVGKQSSVDVSGATVGDAMNSLVAQHPDLRKHLYTEEGKLRAFVSLYVNDEDIRYLQEEATPLAEGDNISIVPFDRSPEGPTDAGLCPDFETQIEYGGFPNPWSVGVWL